MISNSFIQMPTGENLAELNLSNEIVEQVSLVVSAVQEQQLAKKESDANDKQAAVVVLFYGTEEVVKQSVAASIGKETGSNVLQVDWSAVASKYITETERKLNKIFKNATDRKAVLLFDEADSLFGKRTRIKDANDRYANEEKNYLVKLIENHEGLIVLSTKTKGNIDAAFLRRLHSIIRF